jgi:hypothetical protein
MHLHPTVLKLLIPLAIAHGAQGLRLPRDDPWLGLAYDRGGLVRRLTWVIVLGLLSRYGSRQLGRQSLSVPRRVYGLMQTGQMNEAYVLRVLRQIREPSAELYFHPSIRPEGTRPASNPGDLDTLLSPAVRLAIEERGMNLATYSTLKPR